MTLMQRISKYLKDNRIPPTRFGRIVAGDPRLIGDMRNGRELRLRLQTRIREYLDSVGG